MVNKLQSAIVAVLIVSLMHLGMISSAQAVIVETESVQSAVADQLATENNRAKLTRLIERPEVTRELTQWGFSKDEALARVNAMTDEEVTVAAQKLEKLPAGADGLGTIIGVLLFVFIVLLITDVLGLTKVFPFTRSVR